MFYVEAALQIKRRFPIKLRFSSLQQIINPDTINSTSAEEIVHLALKFLNIIASA
jgi:hypothetical protein